ncbi:hypothetical protein [Bacillus phage BC-T25]|nr:hypothetical protein [Bacillus phage BC-T25]
MSKKPTDVQKVKDILANLNVDEHLDIVNCVSVWSTGTLIRRYTGQGSGNNRSPEKGYKKMVAILVELPEEEIQG